jgi:hypothetical protein
VGSFPPGLQNIVKFEYSYVWILEIVSLQYVATKDRYSSRAGEIIHSFIFGCCAMQAVAYCSIVSVLIALVNKK